MTEQETIVALNKNAPGFIKLLGGRVIEVNRERRECAFEFNIGTDLCHSVNVVQGGFITAMLDAAMTHSVFSCDTQIVNVSSLEIKTSYMEPTLAGKLRAVGRIVKAGYKVAFLEAHLYNDEGLLTATTSSVAKLIRAKS